MPTLANITLASPWMLLGLAALAAPLLAHRLRRRAALEITFPTIALLSQTAAGRRPQRWTHHLLLALRCLAIVALVLTFAQPAWHYSGGAAVPAASGPAAVVFIIDNSASSGQLIRGQPILDELRILAHDQLAALPQGQDVADIVVTCNPGTPAGAHALLPWLTPNTAPLYTELDHLGVVPQRGDLGGALVLAGRLLEARKNNAEQRCVVVFSDLQRTNWADVSGAALPPGTSVSVVGAPSTGLPNTAVLEVHATPSQPVAHEKAQIQATIANHGPTTVTLPVDAAIDGLSLSTVTLTLPPWSQAPANFDTAPLTPGPHEVTVSIPDDSQPLDNRGYLALHAADRLNVLMISDADASQPEIPPFYLARALAPRGDDGDVSVHIASAAVVNQALLAPYPVVVLADAAPLPVEATRALGDHIRAGRGLIAFCTTGPVRENLAAINLQTSEAAPFPRLPIAWRDPALPAPTLDQGDWHDPLLHDLDEPARHALAAIAFPRVWTFDTAPGNIPSSRSAIRNPQSEIPLAFSDNTPALLRGPASTHVLLANLGPLTGDSDLPRHGLFVALLQAMLHDARPTTPPQPTTSVGQTCRLRLPGSTRVTPDLATAGPDAITHPANPIWHDAQWEVHLPTDRPGFYRLYQGERLVDTAAAMIDARESDLRPIDATAATAMLAPPPPVAPVPAYSATQPADSSAALEMTLPLWPWALLAACAALAVEMALLGWRP